MTVCQSIDSTHFPNQDVCEWLAEATGEDPQAWDSKTSYFQLVDPLRPQQVVIERDGRLSPSELAARYSRALDDELRGSLQPGSDGTRPLAESFVRRFGSHSMLFPSFIPKPSNTNESRRRLAEVTSAVQTGNPLFMRQLAKIQYDALGFFIEDDLMAILEAGVATCAGLGNVFHFMYVAVRGECGHFVDIYRTANGIPQPHYGFRNCADSQNAYDYSLQIKVTRDTYDWFDLSALDLWALSLINTGLTRLKRGEIESKQYVDLYVRRALELAPNNYRVVYNGGVAISGLDAAANDPALRDEGARLMKRAVELYPPYSSRPRGNAEGDRL
jgi:hypothetical protein